MKYNIEDINSLSTKELYDIAHELYLGLDKDRDVLWEYHHNFELKWLFKKNKRKEYYKSLLNIKETIEYDFYDIVKLYGKLKTALRIINEDIVNEGIEPFDKYGNKRKLLINCFVESWVSEEIFQYIAKMFSKEE